jgi:hypothetical protein
MQDTRKDDPSTVAGPSSLDFVIYEIEGNGNNGADDAEMSSFGEDGYTPALDQLPNEYQICDSDAEPADDLQECIAIAEQSCSDPEIEPVGPDSEVEMISQTPEVTTDRAQAAAPDQQPSLPHNSSAPALGPISDLLKTKPAGLQQAPQTPPVRIEPNPVKAQPTTVHVAGGNGGSPSVKPSVRAHVAAKPEAERMAGTQLINLYEQGQRDFSGENLRKANLRGASLQNIRLIMANLEEADLSTADLSGARLIQANLARVNLQAAVLTRAKLTGADLHGADLRNADMEDADLTGADLRGANLLGANLLGVRLTGADLDQARLSPNWQLVWQIVSTENGTSEKE